jgi:hypothetical protein
MAYGTAQAAEQPKDMNRLTRGSPYSKRRADLYDTGVKLKWRKIGK